MAKTAARRQGMTLGEWLNRVILEDGPLSSDWSDRLSAFPGFTASPDGVGGGGDDDLHEMIARLGARIEAAESRAQLAISGVDQSVNGLARRLERIEDGLEDEEESTQAALTRMRASQDELMDRLRKLERNGGSGDTAPVRAVEAALGKVAARLYETERDFRSEIDGLLDREDRRKDGAEKSIRTLAERIDEAERRTRAEEQSLRDLVEQRHKDMTSALEGVHDGSRAMQRRLVAAESATFQAADALAKSHERLEARLAQLEQGSGSAMTQEQFQQRFDRLATELAEVIRDTRREFAGQLDALARSGGQGGRFEQALQATEARLSAAETRQADTLARISQEVSRLARAIDRRFTDNESRMEARLREEEQRRSQLRNQADIESRLDDVRRESSHAVRQIGEQVAKLGETLAERVSNAEERSARALEAAGERMARVVETLDANGRARSDDDVLQERIAASEERTAARIAEAMQGVHARLDAARTETSEALSPVQRAMTALAERLEAIEQNALHEPPRRKMPAAAFEKRAESASEPAPEADSFASPLKPPPGQREAALQGEFAISGAGSFVVAVEDPLTGPQRQEFEQSAQDSGEEDVWQEAPRPAPMPEPARRTRAAQVLGATADAEFLSAARRKIRTGGSDPARYDYTAAQAPQPEGSRSRWLLAGVSLLGFLALGAAAAFVLTDGFNRGTQTAQSDISAEALSSLFADVRTEPTAPAEPASADESASASSGEAAPADALDAPVEVSAAPARPVQTPSPSTQQAEAPAVVQPAANTLPDTPLTLEAAATAGDPVARYQLALQRFEAGDTQGGVTLIRRAAEQGVPDAQFRYGRMLERGEGVTADPDAGRQWMVRAAENGHLRAMYEAGVAYVNQPPTPANQQAAARWFEQAALHGMGDSQFNLGLLFEEGFGVPQSAADAYAWFLIAAAGGDSAASERAAGLRRELSAEERAAAEDAARGFAPRTLDPQAQGRYPAQTWEQGAGTRLIARAQELLFAMGYGSGQADGAYGPQTREAVVAYQRAQGLEASGAIDTALVARLERGPSR
ncbi:polar development protein PodJ [Glycocaulis alkaliphilus]|uniref:Polar development protein PodJ n=2 Tax=Glycocaulis alkaliphilus TaxID=1434191 RepID=A0A3T0EBQ5_9PROT|nr:polar development protein PodJ [Glycocaulis alkaliphilus]